MEYNQLYENINNGKSFVSKNINNFQAFVQDSIKIIFAGGIILSSNLFAETYKIPQIEFENSLVKGLFERGLLQDRKKIIENGKEKIVKSYNIDSDTVTILADTFSKMGKVEILTDVAEKYKNKSILEKFKILKKRLKYYKKIETRITGLSDSLDSFRKNEINMDILWNEYKKVLHTADYIGLDNDLELSTDVKNEIDALFSSYFEFGKLEEYKKRLQKKYSKNKEILEKFINKKSK